MHNTKKYKNGVEREFLQVPLSTIINLACEK